MRSVILVLRASLALRGIAEEVPKPIAKEAAPTPPAGQEPAKATTPAKASAAQGLPVFPLKSPHFAEIDDSQDARDNGTPPGMEIDVASLLDILPALRASTPQHLKANIDKDADFKKLFLHPDKYRGHVVEFDGNVEFLFDKPETIKESPEITSFLSRGHVQTSWRVLSYLSLTPPPKGMKVGDAVRVTGIFLQRFAYVNREMPGTKLSWTPLLIVQKLEPIVSKEESETSMVSFVGYLLFAMVAVALILSRLAAKRGVVNRANIFRRMRIEREGKDRLFPKAKK